MSTAPKAQRCVWCRQKPVDPAWRPFCSERCKVRDLAQWADGRYRVAGEGASGHEATDNPDVSSPQSTELEP